jgi:O-antigen/teichoic acid export membrane protein
VIPRAVGDALPLGPTGILIVTRVAALLTGLFAVMISARLYGADGRGVLAAFAVLQFLGATGLALGSGSGAFLAAHQGKYALSDVASGLVTVAVGLGLLTGAIAGFAWMTGFWSVLVPRTSGEIAVALGPAVAGQYLVLGCSQVAMGAGAAWRTAFGWILGPLVMLGSVAIAGVAGLSVGDLLIVQSFVWSLTGLTFVVVCGARMPSLRVAVDIVRLGRGAALGDLTNALSYRLDVLLVVWLAGTSAAGVYSLATQLMEPLWLLATSTAGGLLIGFRGQDERVRRRSTARGSRRVGILTTVGVLGVVGLMPVVSALAGPGFEGAVVIGAFLGPGIVFLAVARVLAAYQTSMGRLWLGSAIATVAVTIAVLGGLILIPSMGAIGAAIVASSSYGFACLLWLISFRGFDPSHASSGAHPRDEDRHGATS